MIKVASYDELQELFGDYDANLRNIKKQLRVRVYTRGLEVVISGERRNVEAAREVLEKMIDDIRERGYLEEESIEGYLNDTEVESAGSQVAQVQNFAPKTDGQKRYLDAIEENEMTLCFGPAGTGKTYLAVAMAISFFKRNLVRRIVLCRPAVEAGENLGFLPGTMQEKVNPYLIPLFDALNDLLKFDRVRKLMDQNIIEIAPLAFMRGRSLNNSFIILDEAQNTTNSQMKMFLTRMGRNSRVVVTGDITQVDLEEGKRSGFSIALELLKSIRGEGISIVELTDKDVVRHPLVQRIINAYETYETERGIVIANGSDYRGRSPRKSKKDD